MTHDEIVGRLCAVETIAMMALGLYLTKSRNDPDYAKARGLIEHMKEGVADNARRLPVGARPHAIAHSKAMFDLIAENLTMLRGEGGQLS